MTNWLAIAAEKPEGAPRELALKRAQMYQKRAENIYAAIKSLETRTG
jgi:hypothetical protein